MKPLPVSDHVLMVTAPNPGPKTLDGTNVYLVSDGGRSALIDAGPGRAAYLRDLGQLCRAHNVQSILLTHSHPDHADGAQQLAADLDVQVFLSHKAPPGVRDALGDRVRLFTDDMSVEIADLSIEVIPTPGHAEDHVCFLLHPAEILFSGDTILGEGTSLVALPEGDMAGYMNSLRSLAAREIMLIAPGHGPLVRDPKRKIDAYLEHRRQRETEILARLDAGPATIADLTGSIYGTMDEEHRRLASLSVEAQLDKLRREHRVAFSKGVYSINASSYPESPGMTNS